MKNEGLKRGLQSIDSSDYQMGENMAGAYLSFITWITFHFSIDRLEPYVLHSRTKDEIFVKLFVLSILIYSFFFFSIFSEFVYLPKSANFL